MRRIYRLFVFVFLPLFVGFIIYVFFRKPGLMLDHWFPFMDALRPKMPFRLGDSIFAEFVLFQLPDALWAFSLMYVFLVIWKDAKSSVKFIWVLIGVLFVYGIEFSQYVGSGTFDGLDLLAITVAMALAFYASVGLAPLRRS